MMCVEWKAGAHIEKYCIGAGLPVDSDRLAIRALGQCPVGHWAGKKQLKNITKNLTNRRYTKIETKMENAIAEL